MFNNIANFVEQIEQQDVENAFVFQVRYTPENPSVSLSSLKLVLVVQVEYKEWRQDVLPLISTARFLPSGPPSSVI